MCSVDMKAGIYFASTNRDFGLIRFSYKVLTLKVKNNVLQAFAKHLLYKRHILLQVLSTVRTPILTAPFLLTTLV